MDNRWIWERPDWPNLTWDPGEVALMLSEVSARMGRLGGRMADQALESRERTQFHALTEDALQTSAIEGERLDPLSVRSSLARRLGIENEGMAPVDRRTEGLVAMLLDATANANAPLTDERLRGWQAALFPEGYGVLQRVRGGHWRDDHEGPMQVVSGPDRRRVVHFQAPPASCLDQEMRQFLAWFEDDVKTPWLVRAALAHLWFVTVHPFEDGNGRVGRAVSDLALARGDGLPERYYSVSSQMSNERSTYYQMLESSQRGGLDVTPWVLWFLGCVGRALQRAETTLDSVLRKSRFWNRWQGQPVSERQAKVLNRVFDGLGRNGSDEALTNRKWAKLAGVSSDTALRDLRDLVERGMLTSSGVGKATIYTPAMD